jgi:mono/diheme cytochrome c family protein
MERLYKVFVILSFGALLFFILSLWKDYNREWKVYQKGFKEMELAKAKDDAERRKVNGQGYQFIQYVVADGERVDRCVMCHRGIEDPRFVDAPQPYTTHPSIPEHPFERFGCTVCHQGQGRATTYIDAHGGIKVREGTVLPSGKVAYIEELKDPLLTGQYVQSSCGSCHIGVDLKEASLLTMGKRLFQEKGCMGCHQVTRVGGKVGPELTFIGEKRSEPEWHFKHFQAPNEVSPGTPMPSYKDLSEEELRALTVFMLSLKEIPFSLVAFAPLGPQTVVALVPPPPPPKDEHWETPLQMSRMKNPIPSTQESVAIGKRLYDKYCASCHGATGKGDGEGAPIFKPRPAIFADAEMMEHETDGSLFWKIGNGRGLMPGWNATMGEEERWHLVNYLRTFSKMGMGEMMEEHEEAEPHGHGEEEEEHHD